MNVTKCSRVFHNAIRYVEGCSDFFALCNSKMSLTESTPSRVYAARSPAIVMVLNAMVLVIDFMKALLLALVAAVIFFGFS